MKLKVWPVLIAAIVAGTSGLTLAGPAQAASYVTYCFTYDGVPYSNGPVDVYVQYPTGFTNVLRQSTDANGCAADQNFGGAENYNSKAVADLILIKNVEGAARMEKYHGETPLAPPGPEGWDLHTTPMLCTGYCV